MSLRVLVADDHQIVRQGFRAILERAGFEVTGEATNGREAIALALAQNPDVVVIDLMMPQLNGLEAAREILASRPGTRFVLLTMHTEDRYVVAALRAGIRGYVVKTQAADALLQAISSVAAGDVYLSPGVSRVLVDGYLAQAAQEADPLAPRERQVLQLVAEGRTTKEIAALLDLTVRTAETYRTRIMEKLDIHETAGLVRYAIRRGLVEP